MCERMSARVFSLFFYAIQDYSQSKRPRASRQIFLNKLLILKKLMLHCYFQEVSLVHLCVEQADNKS